jgi:hypothetical protein
MVGDPAEAVERESRGLWGKTGQRSLERSACLALLVRKPATKVRFWHFSDIARCLTLVRNALKSGRASNAGGWSKSSGRRRSDHPIIIVA